MDGLSRNDAAASRWLRRCSCLLAVFCAQALLVAAPLSCLWLYKSGDSGVSRAVEAQGKGFALFGSGLERGPADLLSYKLALYAAKKPSIVVLGSSGMGALRDSVFSRPMLNMAGTADSLSSLRESVDAMCAVHRPEVALLALDFWWFSEAWEKDPFARAPRAADAYGISPDALRMPWRRLLEGSISLPQFLFLSFRDGRFGLRAQFRDEGHGPDGSLYSSPTLTGSRPGDRGFRSTLERLRRRAGEFAPQSALSQAHLDAFADIFFRLRGRGVTPVVFLSPLAGPVHEALKADEASYPQLFLLRQALLDRGIAVAETADAGYFGAGSCEFLDGTHAGEVAAARALRELASSWNGLLEFVNMERLNQVLNEWRDHAAVRSAFLPEVWETDFLGLDCKKRTR